MAMVAILVIAAVIGIPKWQASRAARRAAQAAQATPIVSEATPASPTERDTDGDGIKDWQEVALGLDPDAKETNQGISDATLYDVASQQSGPTSLEEFNTATDTDKITYTIFDRIKQVATDSGSLDDAAISAVTSQEVQAYITALAPADRYSRGTVTIIPSSPKNDADYKNRVAAIGTVDWFDPKNHQVLMRYLATGEQAEIIRAQATRARDIAAQYARVPVPDAIADAQISVINALDHMATLVLGYDAASSDAVRVMSEQILVRMYEWSLLKNAVIVLEHYQDPNAAIIRAALESVAS